MFAYTHTHTHAQCRIFFPALSASHLKITYETLNTSSDDTFGMTARNGKREPHRLVPVYRTKQQLHKLARSAVGKHIVIGTCSKQNNRPDWQFRTRTRAARPIEKSQHKENGYRAPASARAGAHLESVDASLKGVQKKFLSNAAPLRMLTVSLSGRNYITYIRLCMKEKTQRHNA